MNPIFLSHVLSLALLACPTLPVPTQQPGDDEIVRNFVSTRGTEVITSGRRRQKPKPGPAGPIGFGYTLFKQNAHGEWVRVNPSQELRSGDKVRFVIESNTAGYLYLFHQADDAPPKMLYPDARLKRGDNRIGAHVQYEVPSGQEPGDWGFNFVGPAATERFYLVVARRPLPEVWTGEGLVAYCQQYPQHCPWRPADSTWKQLLAQANTAARESRSRTFGEVQTEIERQAIRREVKLQPSDSAPSVIKVTASPAAKMLMTTVELVHK